MNTRISTFLMFTGAAHGRAEEAIELYTSLFENSTITSIEKYGPNENEPEGTVKLASFILNGTSFKAIDSAMGHSFTFNPAVSLFIEFADEAKLDAVFKALSVGGSVMMPLDKYPFSKKFGWMADKYGVNWQLFLV